MSAYAIVLTKPNDEAAIRIKERFPKHYQASDSCYLVRSDDIAGDVAVAGGIEGDDRINESGGAVFRLNGAFSGYAPRTLGSSLALRSRQGV